MQQAGSILLVLYWLVVLRVCEAVTADTWNCVVQ